MILPDLAGLAADIATLSLLPGNPRVGDVDAVAASLSAFGQRKPIVARRDGMVVAGNHTLQAARQLGWSEIAVVWVDDDDTTAAAFALADNRTAELGSYDERALADLIAEVQAADEDLLASTGWTGDDLAELLERLEVDERAPALEDLDAVPEGVPAKTVPGDVWLLGDHRVMCGDCRDADHVTAALGGATIAMAFTSPPYADRRKYDPSSGFVPIPPDEYVEWFAPVAANVAAHLAEDGSWFVNIKAGADGLDTELYVFDLVLAHARRWGWHFATDFCWERNGVPKNVTRRFKNQFELIYQFAKGEWKMRPEGVMHWSQNVPIPLGDGAGDTSWNPKSTLSNADAQGSPGHEWFKDRNGPGMAYPGNRLPTFAGSHEATGHGAAFPVGLPEWFVKAYTDAGDVVFDPFLGSGSTLLAASANNRVAVGMEISPAYVDIAVSRWQRTTGQMPVLESTGEAHDFTDGTDATPDG